MAIPRFHVDHLQAGELTLSPSESQHAARARRLKPGDRVAVFDGAGNTGEAVIVQVSSKAVRLDVQQCCKLTPLAHPLTLVTALPKGARQDLYIEKCTELGVSRFVPVKTERSVAQASAHRIEKWRRTSIEAAKQCGLSWLPSFEELQPLSEWLVNNTPGVPTFVAVAEQDIDSLPDGDISVDRSAIRAMSEVLADVHSQPRAEGAIFLIGPEGGWTTDELREILSRDIQPVTLGDNTLRIETAGIAVAAAFHMSQTDSA
jgi:16S rRNA (uracil1498-N3)-methyltransferase